MIGPDISSKANGERNGTQRAGSPGQRRKYQPVIILCSVVVAAGICFCLFVPLAQFLAKQAFPLDPKHADDKFAVAVASARTLIAGILGGSIGLAGIYLSWLNLERTRNESLRAQALSRESVELSRLSRTTDSFIKAVEQIGSSNTSTRVGGVYGLGRLLRSASPEDDYWPIMDVLNSFVRNWSRTCDPNRLTREPPEDIQAALQVIARRGLPTPERQGDAPVDLHECFLGGSYLNFAKLQCAYLDKADLSNTALTASDLYRAWLDGANMAGAHLDDASLVEARFIGAILTDADMRGANCQGADFTGADIFRADLRGADLLKAIVTDLQLSSAIGNSDTILPEGVNPPTSWI